MALELADITRVCEWCIQPLTRGTDEKLGNYKKRRFCGRGCHSRSMVGLPKKRASKAPGGYGSISKAGYRTIYLHDEKKLALEHRLVWEKVNGPIPEGMVLHHIDENPLNNTIENLQLVTRSEHRLIHAGYLEIDGVMTRPCIRCKERKPLTEFGKKGPTYHSSWCKGCMREYAQKRRDSHVSS
jgi:hypothetical protein